jgi:purine-binding chemotaxis protein CheW
MDHSTAMAGLAGKYMTFKLAQEVYAVEILKVREIIGLMDITRVPRSKSFLRGVINLRGKVIPVVDLRLKFEMDQVEATDQTIIIVVNYQHQGQDVTMGILVDEVLEVLSVDGGQIEPAPTFGSTAINKDFILGVAKVDKRVLFLLDIAKVLDEDEIAHTVAAAGGPGSTGA